MDKVTKKVKNLIAEKAGVELHEVTDEAFLMDDLNMGELELEEIFTTLEDDFHIEFEEEEKEEVETVADLVDLVLEKAE